MQLLQCSVVIMTSEIVDQALKSYEFTPEIDVSQLAYSRERIERYIDKLMAAGHEDPHRLTEFALEYLKELHEGPDLRFTGC